MKRIVAVMTVVGLGLGACGLGEREAFADRLTAAVTAAVARGTVAGTISSTIQIADAPIEIPDDQRGASFELQRAFVADLGARWSQLNDTNLVHDGLVLHLKRADADENDARPWLTLDVAALPEDAGLPFLLGQRRSNLPFAIFALPPAIVVDLMAGALTGSLRSIGIDEIEGAAVHGYEGKFDIDKMLFDTRDDHYDHDTTKAVEHAFEVLDIPSNVHSGTVWLDDAGLPRRFEVTFEHKPRRRWAFAVTVTIDLVEWGVPVTIERPAPDQTIEIGSFVRLVNELPASFPLPEEPELPAIPTTSTTEPLP